MKNPYKDIAHIEEREAVKLISQCSLPFITLFQRHDISVELYQPHIIDLQKPHDRDEIYIISSGTGKFRRGKDLFEFQPGDFLFVPAFEEHCFESFSDDFRTWVIFFGPKNVQRDNG